MISGLSPSNEQFLASLNILQNNLSQADEQLSSGLSVNQASDAPQSIQDIFVTRAALGQANPIGSKPHHHPGPSPDRG